MKKLIRLSAVLALSATLLCPLAQGQGRGANRLRRVAPNTHAPDLYADRLRLRFSLINLPGAARAGSYWEASYKLYFIDERAYQQTLDSLARGNGGSFDPEPSQFQSKILLSEGSFRSRQLRTLQQRTHLTASVPFKARVPDGQRTKLGRLMVNYSVKIYDAQLKQTFYDARSWLSLSFDDDPSQPGQEVARRVLYANFFVSPQGDLFKSQWARNDTDVDW